MRRLILFRIFHALYLLMISGVLFVILDSTLVLPLHRLHSRHTRFHCLNLQISCNRLLQEQALVPFVPQVFSLEVSSHSCLLLFFLFILPCKKKELLTSCVLSLPLRSMIILLVCGIDLSARLGIGFRGRYYLESWLVFWYFLLCRLLAFHMHYRLHYLQQS